MSGIVQALFMGGAASVTPGQTVIEPSSIVVPLDTSWVVPAGVTAISYVLVSGGGDSSITLKRNGVVQSSVASASRSGVDGGGNGGSGGASNGAGGGAGGYSGDGGDGGVYSTGTPSNGAAGAGGGGGGGGGGHLGIHPNPDYNGEIGGGVGLLGIGSNGFAGTGAYFDTPPSAGGPGSGGNPSNGKYGAGSVSTTGTFGQDGGGLGYKNNLAVAPGDTIRIECGVPSSGYNLSAARIMWGGGRSYPSNAANM